MSNKDLLKQAIAEAKTIREAAIANAKEALEETLTPHLKEMLAQKLQEMEDSEEETVDETINNSEEQDYSENPNTHGNLEEAEEEEEETEEGEEETEEGEEEEDVDVKDMSVDELKDLIRDIVSQEVGHDKSEEEIPGEETPEGDDMTGMDSEEEIDLNELLAELAEMDGDEDTMDEYTSAPTDRGTSHKNTGKELDIQLANAIKSIAAKTGKSYEAIAQFLYGGKKATPAEFEEGVQQDLQEALATVKQLRNQLQEVNLLNAKLLYVNKVFKANNLTESQKVNVVAAFDKAETVKEVKLVFETVSKNVVAKPTTIKEHKSFASSAAGTAATAGKKEIISEVSEQVARWQKLAGIIK